MHDSCMSNYRDVLVKHEALIKNTPSTFMSSAIGRSTLATDTDDASESATQLIRSTDNYSL